MTKKSGLADSPFFTPADAPQIEPLPTPPVVTATADAAGDAQQQPVLSPTTTETAGDTMPPRYHDGTIAAIRRAVKELGKEAATHRFTPAEKSAIADVVYRCKRQGLRTSENEITRIAVNYLLVDYRDNGPQSVLARVLEALNA